MQRHIRGRRGEDGFTLIELLIVVSIIGILAALGVTTFTLMKERAEYARGQDTLRSAQTAFEVGDQEAAPGTTVALTYTGDAGGAVGGALGALLPGAVTPLNVDLGAMYEYCDSSSPPLQVKQFLNVVPCNSTRRLTWTRFCGGTEIRLENLPNPGCENSPGDASNCRLGFFVLEACAHSFRFLSQRWRARR
ncbi:MAG: type II secretion system protein [Deltaproteobacteria bacterium]|nr:type II secretion system protein [Deltaproteobacteria bacterium]